MSDVATDTRLTAPQDANAAPAAAPDPEQVYRDVAALALFLQRTAIACRIVIDSADANGDPVRNVIAVPLSTPATVIAEDSLAGRMLAILGRLKTGEWLNGGALGYELGGGMTPERGDFKKAISRLKADKLIDSGRGGYRLKSR